MYIIILNKYCKVVYLIVDVRNGPDAGGFIAPHMTKRFDLWISIFGSYECQKPISYKNLVVQTNCKRLVKIAPEFCKKWASRDTILSSFLQTVWTTRFF